MLATAVLGSLLLVYAFHSPLAGVSSASPVLRDGSGPTHTTHPMVPVPQPPQPQVTSNAASSSSICPLPSSQCLPTYNWGGYAVCTPQPECSTLEGVAGQVTDVTASWVVPAVTDNQGYGYGFQSPSTGTCSDNENTWYDDADWIGIDGFVSQTVEQTGTSSDCYYGQLYYYAWYEFYPAASVLITSITVHPGDLMTAEVTETSSTPYPTFTTTIEDMRTHQSFTSPPTAVPGALTDSAEWISESAYYIGFLALTPTTPVQFSGASATIGGVTHTISGWGTSVFYLLMVDFNFGINQETGVPTPSTETLAYAKADPSSLSRSGDGFTVTWLSSGP